MKCTVIMLLLAASGAGAQEETSSDQLMLRSRKMLQGTLVSSTTDGALVFRTAGGRVRRIPQEAVLRLTFGNARTVQTDFRSPKVYFVHGSFLSGAVRRYEKGRFEIDSIAGKVQVRREDVRSVSFSKLIVPLPQIKDKKLDVLIIVEEGRKKGTAKYGTLVRISDTSVTLRQGGKESDYPRSSARQVYLHRSKAPKRMPPGWFAKVTFENGDKVVGVLSRVGDERIRLFSHLIGGFSVDRSKVHSITFVRYARTVFGHVIVCDRSGVREFDRAGKEVWKYGDNVQHAWAAVRLENGNTLVANTNYNQILEISPEKQVVWRLNNVNYPYDIQRLENGNTLVAEYYANQVCEYDRDGKKVWTTKAVRQPTSVQRLENGNTLISSNTKIMELNGKGKQVWRPTLRRVRAWKSRRLENGNTLICDRTRGQVIEIASKGAIVWKKSGLSRPVSAVRLENGNTLILEQGAGRVIEVNPSGLKVSEIDGLNYPQSLTAY